MTEYTIVVPGWIRSRPLQSLAEAEAALPRDFTEMGFSIIIEAASKSPHVSEEKP